MVSKLEKHETLKLIDGVPRSLDWIIQRYAGLVHHLAFRHQGEYEKDDLVSEGYIGLIKAYRRYDQGKNSRFQAYAWSYINGSMLRLNRKPTQIYFPHQIVSKAWIIVKHDLEDESVTEIAQALNISNSHAERALLYLHIRNPERMDKILFVDGEVQLHDVIGSVDDLTGSFVEDFLNSLVDRERIIVNCLLQDMNQREIAKVVGVSQMHISRIVRRIREKYEDWERCY